MLSTHEPPYPTPTDGDLWLKAMDFLRVCRPKVYKELSSSDEGLEDLINSRIAACKRYAMNLIAGGTWEGEAWNLAIRQELLESETD